MADKAVEPTEWVPAFEGQRPPFEPGHALSTRHGAYASVVKLTPRATEIAGFLRDSMGSTYSDRFEIALQSAGAVGARYELALAALVEGDPLRLQTLDKDARGWARLWFSILSQLGLTPYAASKQGLNLALGADVAQRALERHVAGEYGPLAVLEVDESGGDA